MTEKINPMNPSGYVLKVLSGQMNGIEFPLGPHAYFMCVNDAADGQDNLAKNVEFAERTLYLPTSVPGHNFVIDLAEQVTEKEFTVTISYPDRQEKQTVTFNTVCQIEGIYFALKREGDTWSQDVQNGVPTVVPGIESKKTASLVTKRTSSRKYPWIIALCTSLLLSAGSVVAWQKYSTASASDATANALQELIGNNLDYSLQRGRDNTYYLFAQTSQKAEWARRSIIQSNIAGSWKVRTPREEELRLARLLEQNHIAFFNIRLNDLNAPTLIMSSTRNATDPVALERVKKALSDAIPYAEKVNIELKADQDILRMAEEGLVALGFDYQMTQSDSGVTLSSSMSAGDGRMAEFNRFVSQFYRLWGRHYVHFSVELHEDGMKEKSYKYGQDGYVKLGKSHWQFNT